MEGGEGEAQGAEGAGMIGYAILIAMFAAIAIGLLSALWTIFLELLGFSRAASASLVVCFASIVVFALFVFLFALLAVLQGDLASLLTPPPR